MKFLPEDLFVIKGKGLVVTGALLEGSLVKGMNVHIAGKTVEISGIESFRKNWESINSSEEAAKGIGLLLKGVEKEDIEPLIKNHEALIF